MFKEITKLSTIPYNKNRVQKNQARKILTVNKYTINTKSF